MFFDPLHWEKERVVFDSAMESTSLLAATTSKLNGLVHNQILVNLHNIGLSHRFSPK